MFDIIIVVLGPVQLKKLIGFDKRGWTKQMSFPSSPLIRGNVSHFSTWPRLFITPTIYPELPFRSTRWLQKSRYLQLMIDIEILSASHSPRRGSKLPYHKKGKKRSIYLFARNVEEIGKLFRSNYVSFRGHVAWRYAEMNTWKAVSLSSDHRVKCSLVNICPLPLVGKQQINLCFITVYDKPVYNKNSRVFFMLSSELEKICRN